MEGGGLLVAVLDGVQVPGYTGANLSEKGIHEVSQRRFVLVASDHPVVAAIHENAEKLQMGEIAVMPEGLIKSAMLHVERARRQPARSVPVPDRAPRLQSHKACTRAYCHS